MGSVTGGVGVGGTLFTYAAFRSEFGSLGWGVLPFPGGVTVVTVLFSSLPVVVDEGELRFFCGPCFWTRRIPLAAIRQATYSCRLEMGS